MHLTWCVTKLWLPSPHLLLLHGAGGNLIAPVSELPRQDGISHSKTLTRWIRKIRTCCSENLRWAFIRETLGKKHKTFKGKVKATIWKNSQSGIWGCYCYNRSYFPLIGVLLFLTHETYFWFFPLPIIMFRTGL